MNVTEELLQKLHEEFEELTYARHQRGAEEYGPVNYLKVDLPQFIYEEMADIANYARYLYVRVRILEEAARERGLDLSAGLSQEGGKPNQVPYGPTAFTPSAALSGFLSDKES